MPLYQVCVIGDTVDQGAQLVSVEASTAAELSEALSRSVQFSPADHNKIISMNRLAMEYNCWVQVSPNLEGLAQSGEKVHVFTEKNVTAALDAVFLEVVLENVIGSLVAAPTAQQSLRSALRDAKTLFRSLGGPQGLSELQRPGSSLSAFQERLCLELRSSSSSSGGGSNTIGSYGNNTNNSNNYYYPQSGSSAAVPSSDVPATLVGGGARKSAAPSSRGGNKAVAGGGGGAASEADTRTSASVTPRMNNNNISTTVDVTTTINASIAAAAAMSGPAYTTTSSGTASSDTITVYCVYSGTTSQRAKAIRIPRLRPTIDLLLGPLAQKFHSDLALGFIYPDGTCCELLTDADLNDLLTRISSANGSISSVTLHCWAKGGVTFDEEVTQSSTSRALTPAAMDTTSQSSAGGSTTNKSARPNKSSRPQSAMSIRSNKSTPGSVSRRRQVQPTPMHPLDVSGVASTPDQLRELFEVIDVDQSGALSKREFFKYMTESYDSMGIPNFRKKLEALINGCSEFSDGELNFEEFSLIMLKVAQW